MQINNLEKMLFEGMAIFTESSLNGAYKSPNDCMAYNKGIDGGVISLPTGKVCGD